LVYYGYTIFSTLQYSDELKENFIKWDHKISINFKLSGKISVESYICALPIFKAPEMIRDNVTTCAKHKEDVASQSNSFTKLLYCWMVNVMLICGL